MVEMNTDKPRVTLGLPVYNGAGYLEEAVRSCLAQSYDRLTVLISDNCSTDETPEICARLATEDPRVRYHRNDRNLGAALNFNLVAKRADSEFFAWVNHDDLWGEGYIEAAVARLDARPGAVLAYPHAAKIDDLGVNVAPLMRNLGLDDPSPSRRVRRFHDLFQDVDKKKGWAEDEIEGLWIPVYGLMRTGLLKRTNLIGPYISSDTVLLEELLLLGAFEEIEEELFFKRDHTGRSMRAAVPYDNRQSWFNGTEPGRLLFPRWRSFWERLRAVARAPLGAGESLRAWTEMLAFYVRRPSEGKALIKEILINAYRLVVGRRAASRRFPRW